MVIVKISPHGLHYHLPDCPFAKPDQEYIDILIPKEDFDDSLDIMAFGRRYISHVLMCELFIMKKGGCNGNTNSAISTSR